MLDSLVRKAKEVVQRVDLTAQGQALSSGSWGFKPEPATTVEAAVAQLVGMPKPDDAARPLVPAAPLPAVLPSGDDPRAWLASLGENLNMAPRTQSGKKLLPFDVLRNVADFDLVRCAIQDVKGQILGMKWGIRPGEEFKDQKGSLDKSIVAAREWVRVPYARSRMTWRAWVSRVIEEVCTTDALSLYPRRTIGGDPLGLMILDGARIKPLVDSLGEPPLPPNPAFQQIIYGRPETNFYLFDAGLTKPALWYSVMNGRTDSPYGRPPTEAVILTANLALRQQTWDLSYYTTGNIPESLLLAPENWKPDQIAAAQKYIDGIATGKMNRRSGSLLVVPNGTYQATKSRDWQYEFLEFMARLICWAFNVSPLPLAKVMNRATGEQHEQSTAESGVRPLADFIADLVNRYIHEVLGLVEVEFYWLEDENQDRKETAEVHQIYLNAKVITPDEVRADIGKDPLTPEQKDDLNPPPLPGLGGPLDPEGGDPDGAPFPPKKGKTPPADDEADDAVVKAELARWRKVVLRLAKDAKPARPFRSTILPPWTKGLGKALLRKAGSDPEAVRDAFGKVWASYGKQQAIVSALKGTLVAWLDENLAPVQRWATKQLSVAKADAPKGPQLKTDGLFEEFQAALTKALTEGGHAAAIGGGLVFNQAPATALAWATERAAELIGMKVTGYDEGGNPVLAVNPDPEWAITKTLRDDVQAKVAKAIDEGWGAETLKSELESTFGSWRAETIARSETAMAYNKGAIAIYEDSGIDLVEIIDGPGCLPDGHDDSADESSGTPGELEGDAEANGQVWDLETFNRHLIGHPNCVRAAIAYTGGAS